MANKKAYKFSRGDYVRLKKNLGDCYGDWFKKGDLFEVINVRPEQDGLDLSYRCRLVLSFKQEKPPLNSVLIFERELEFYT